jgi:hypothetical protein
MTGRARAMGAALLAATAAGDVAVAGERFAVVDAVYVPTATGGWRATQASPDARHTPAGAATDAGVRVGLVVEEGDLVASGPARLRLRLRGDEVIVVEPGTVFEAGPRTIQQRAGELFQRLHGAFRVRFGLVEAAVEGTRFTVTTDEDGGEVAVDAGSVRVGAPGAPGVVVTRGEAVAVAPGSDAVTPSAQRPAPRGRARALGPARHALSLELGGGITTLSPHGAWRLGGRFTVARALVLSVEAGQRFDAGQFSVPASFGLGLRGGATSIEVAAALRVGAGVRCDPEDPACPGERAVLVDPGVHVALRHDVPVAGRLHLVLDLRAGWVGAPVAEASAGLALGF